MRAGENSMPNHSFGKMPASDRAEEIIEKERASTAPVEKE